jgi:hypothetical protein
MELDRLLFSVIHIWVHELCVKRKHNALHEQYIVVPLTGNEAL